MHASIQIVRAPSNAPNRIARYPGAAPVEITTLSKIAEKHRLARLTRHGEMVAQRGAPTLRMGPFCCEAK